MMRIAVFIVALVGWTISVEAKRVSYVDAKPVKIAVQGAYQVLTCAKGIDDGLAKEWTAKIVVGGREVADAKLVRIDKKSTVVTTTITFDQVPPDLTVRFYPPAP
jgi:hypothetical protein